MKLFIISLLLLAALTVTVVLTARYATASLDALILRAEALTPDGSTAEKASAEVRRAWERAEKFYSLAIDRRELAAIDGLFAELDGAAAARDREAILIAREKLCAALKRMRDEVRPPLSHLL